MFEIGWGLFAGVEQFSIDIIEGRLAGAGKQGQTLVWSSNYLFCAVITRQV